MKGMVLLSLLILVGCRGQGHWEKEEIVLGYSGKARLNPYLAAERYLNEIGLEAESGRTWPTEDESYYYQSIVLPTTFLTTQKQAKRALDWVSGGGVLIIPLEGGGSFEDDFRKDQGWLRETSELPLGLTWLCDELDLRLTSDAAREIVSTTTEDGPHLARPWHRMRIEGFDGEEDFSYEVEFEGGMGVSSDSGTLVSWEDKKSSRFATIRAGAGKMIFLAHARPLRNPYLDRADHAEFLQTLVSWEGEGPVLFLRGSGEGFLGMLWRRAWPLVLAGLILLIIWIWRRIPRFGPLGRDQEVRPRGYADQLTSVGHFLWREGEVGALWEPLRRPFHGRDRQDLAQGAKLETKLVNEALDLPETRDPIVLTRVTQTLKTLHERILR